MKTKIGISAGIIGAAAYFLGLISGFIPVLLIAGYVLIAESNQWLKMCVVKAVVVCLFFELISVFISFIPNAITFIDNIYRLFDDFFTLAIVTKIVNLINTTWIILEKIVLLLFGFEALKMNTIKIGFIDKFVSRHILDENTP